MRHPSTVGRNPAIPAFPYYLRGLSMGIPAILLGLQLSGWIFFVPPIVEGHADFRAYYTAGRLIRLGRAHQLYDYAEVKAVQDSEISRESVGMPFIHPAYEALLFAPFAAIPYLPAYLAFLTLNLALLGISFWLLRPKLKNLANLLWWLPAGLFLVYLPVGAALMQGQDSILLLALLAAAAISLERGHEWEGGALVGLGLFRFQLVLPLALLFVAWRRWRFAGGFCVSAAAMGATSIWLVGLQQTRVYLRLLAAMSVGGVSAVEQLRFAQPVGHMASLRALVFGLGAGHLPDAWLQFITLAFSTAVFLWVALRSPARKGIDALAVGIIAGALLSYHLLIHDLSVLLIPLVLTLDRFISAEATGDRAGRFIARSAAILFVAPVCITFLPYHFYVVALPLGTFLYFLMRMPRSGHVESSIEAGKTAAFSMISDSGA